ncbi:unnamed protein product [Phaedon cochleariae]|uniref:Uncharacterized protein n=1 Tax=Phaedon cochleariae TaxID=80249 RepID=A0A9P0DSA9_PHACE|nr:unnamed protein product [Phaedon cochleariae]
MMKCFNYFILIFSTVTLMEVSSNCTMETYGMYCTNLKTNNESEILVLDLEGENNTNVKSVFLRNSSGSIGEDTFSEISQIDSMDIQFCSIKNISTDMKSLHMLYLINNSELPNITNTLMKHFPELRILYISNNHWLIIQNCSFKSSQNLQHLTIKGQEITKLSNNFLEGLIELTYLDLKGNGIEHIDENAFFSIKKLNHLILNDNKIKQFEANTFSNLTNLESLDLIGTDLVKLDQQVLRNQHELKYIGLPSKLLKENLELKQLTNTFKKLESIGLSYNDKNDTDIDKFIELCRFSGFQIKFVTNME